jgi:hypothetical protein
VWQELKAEAAAFAFEVTETKTTRIEELKSQK